jgi:DNA repair exonuclease SbcCD ATPase subunit
MRFKDLFAECTYSYELLHVKESDFNNGGLTAIIGKNKDQDTANGAGKSNVLKVIYYLLFGKDLTGAAVGEISNRVLDRGHFGQITFEEKGNEYMIQRFHDFKPSKKSILKAKDGSKAKLKGIRFFINGEIFGDKKPNGEPTSDSEIQGIIRAKLGMTPELFLMSVMTAQDSKSNFLMASDTEKKEIISELLNLEVYEQAYTEVNKDIVSQEKQINQAEIQVEEINREFQSKEAEIEVLNTKKQAFEEQIAKEISEVQNVYLSAEKNYLALKKARPKTQDISKIEVLLKTKEEELATQPKDELSLESAEIKILEEQTNECDSTLRQLETESSRINGQLQFLNADIIKKGINELKLVSQIEEARKTIPKNINENSFTIISEEIDSLTKFASSIEKTIYDQTKSIQDVESKKNQVSGQIQLLEAEFSKNSQSVASVTEKVAELKSKIMTNEVFPENLQALSELIEANTKQKAVFTKKQSELGFKISQAETEIVELMSSENCPTCNREWDKDHQGERDQKVSAHTMNKSAAEKELSLVNMELDRNSALLSDLMICSKVIDLSLTLNSLMEASNKLDQLKNNETALNHELAVSNVKLSEIELKRQEMTTKIKEKGDELTNVKNLSASKDTLSRLEKELESLHDTNMQIESLSSLSKSLEAKSSKIRAVSNSLMKKKSDEVDKIREQMRINQMATEKLTAEIKSINNQLNEARLSGQAFAQWEQNVAAAFEKLESLITQSNQISSRNNPFIELLEKVDERKSELKQRRENISVRIEKIQDELKYLYFWKNGFGPTGIRSFISDEVVVHLNEVVRDYLNDLFDGAISVVFESESVSQKGGVSNKISTKSFLNGKETPIGLLSGGERQRVVLAVDLAICDIAESRTGTKINLKFLDEPFNGIDGNGQLKSIALFAKIANRKNGFFIITHDERFQALCQNTIFVVKENEISKVVSKEEFRDAS